MTKYWYRKDVANAAECSVAQVRKNEKAWGIRSFRRDLNARCVRYLREPTEKQLKIGGIIS